ncbi:hypothetical protein KKF86_06720 [bacterium]|nr:hypothetical protein [bacterium]
MALPNYKDIVELIKKGSTLEAQEKIMELREASLELQEENSNLKKENILIKEKLELTKSLKFDGLVYWKNKGSEKEGPFCPTCHDSNGKLIRLHQQTDGWFCYTCRNGFYTKSEADFDKEYIY